MLFTAFMAMSVAQASAEVEILYHMSGGNIVSYSVIERSKRLFILDDDDNTQFKIKNYKKSGNKETFTIEHYRAAYGETLSAQVTTTLDSNGHTCKIEYKKATYCSDGTYDVKTVDTSNPREHNRLIRYFNKETGNPEEQGVVPENGVGNVGKSVGSEKPTDKVKGVAKDATKKVKGLFKKKK